MYQINALNPKDEGHQARKRFGQNFLHDQRVIAKIVRSVNPRAGDNIVEIGPGLAALTSPLIGECDTLTVVELDRDLAAGLPARVPHPERLTIVEADALKYDFSQLAQDGRPLRVVGNLPYNISTPLLFHLFSKPSLYFNVKIILGTMITAINTAPKMFIHSIMFSPSNSNKRVLL